jgi:pyruvate dehydrogenase E2 component (dihydrolipoamide acetyltransferase)
VTEFKLPELGENIDQGDLVRLMVSLGASVTEGQPVMELETDKAVVEVPSSVTGTVNEIRVKEGQKVKVGQVIFTVENGAGAKVKAAESKVVETKAPAAKAPAANSAPVAKAAAASVAETRPPAPAAPAPAASGAADFRLPELGENIDQGDLVRLMISPGSKVSEGQPVMELETDKAVVEVPSSVTGTVKEIKVKEGEKVKVGQVIFTLEGGASAPEKAKHAPVEHISEQHEARLSLQAAIQAEGKTAAQVFLPAAACPKPSM